MTTRAYKVYLFKAGSTSLSTANVDAVYDVSRLSEAPTLNGPRLRLADGHAEASPSLLRIADSTSGGITSHLADASGRLTLASRFVQVLRADAGGAYAPIFGGRLTDAVNADNIAEWQLSVNPEWPTGAQSLIFTTNTTHLYPPCADPGGTQIGFWGFPYRFGYADITRCIPNFQPNKQKFWHVKFRPDNPPMNRAAFDAVAADVWSNFNQNATIVSTHGQFNHLRFRVNGVDYPVVGFVSGGQNVAGVDVYYPLAQGELPTDDYINAHINQGASLNFWIAASSTAFGGSGSASYAYQSGNPFLHMMTAPPSEATPLHIWSGTTAVFGTHPMQVLKDILDGHYSHSTIAYQLPLYSTSSFTGTNDLRRLALPRVGYRITASEPMQDWVEANLCQPFGVMPTVDVTGAVRFRNFRVPSVSTGFSTGTLFGFTSTNLTAAPDWRMARNEAVTVVDVTLNAYGLQGNAAGVAINGTPGADNIIVQTRSTSFYHDRVLDIGQFHKPVSFLGRPIQNTKLPVAQVSVGQISDLLNYVSQNLFARFGDSPIQGTLNALESAATVAPGDWVTVKLPVYPNIGTNARGGTRIVQVLSKTFKPVGYDFDYLDLGAAQSPTSAATLAMTVSTRDPKHQLKFTIGSVGSSGRWTLDLAPTASTAAPANSSTQWHPFLTNIGTGVFEGGKLPSGSPFWSRITVRQPGKAVSSITVSASKVTTSAITAPSGLHTGNIKAHQALSTFAVGDVRYPVAAYVDNSTAASPSTANLYGRFVANTQQVTWNGLDAGAKQRVFVRHYDAYGGFSNTASSVFTTLTSTVGANIIKPPVMAGAFTILGSA